MCLTLKVCLCKGNMQGRTRLLALCDDTHSMRNACIAQRNAQTLAEMKNGAHHVQSDSGCRLGQSVQVQEIGVLTNRKWEVPIYIIIIMLYRAACLAVHQNVVVPKIGREAFSRDLIKCVLRLLCKVPGKIVWRAPCLHADVESSGFHR